MNLNGLALVAVMAFIGIGIVIAGHKKITAHERFFVGMWFGILLLFLFTSLFTAISYRIVAP